MTERLDVNGASKEPPKEIFLQVEEEDDGTDLGGTTWCVDQINETDIRYVLAAPPSDAEPLGPTAEEEAAKEYYGWRKVAPSDASRPDKESEDAPGGPYQMDAVDDIPPELKDTIGRALSDEFARQNRDGGVIDFFAVWRAGLTPSREKLNRLATKGEGEKNG